MKRVAVQSQTQRRRIVARVGYFRELPHEGRSSAPLLQRPAADQI